MEYKASRFNYNAPLDDEDSHVWLRSIEEIGFRPEGIRRERVYRTGQYVDLCCYGLLKSEFYQSDVARWILNRLDLLRELGEVQRPKQEQILTTQIRQNIGALL